MQAHRKLCFAAARIWFAIALLFILALWICGSCASNVLHRLGLLTHRTSCDCSIATGTLCARLLFLLCPHVRLRQLPSHGPRWQPLLESANGGDAPLLLMNHTSFLDLFVMCASVTPMVALRAHLRCIIAAKLTRLPLLGNALGAWSGNFPAHFKAEAGGISGAASASFSTDSAKQAIVADNLHAHVAAGGMLGCCPEGTVNANPAVLLPFRHGAFRIAIEKQMPIFAMVVVGCDECWPKHAAVGGWPATVYVSVRVVTVRTNSGPLRCR